MLHSKLKTGQFPDPAQVAAKLKEVMDKERRGQSGGEAEPEQSS